MKNKKNLIALISILSSFKNEYMQQVVDSLRSVSKILTDKPENIDPVLELRICLHKTFSILILKLGRSGHVSDETVNSVSEAIQELFENKTSYQRLLEKEAYKEYRKNGMDDTHAADLMHGLVYLLLLEAYCDDERIPERMQIVLQLYRGLRGNKPKSPEEISEQFDITRERVRQMKEHAQSIVRKIAKETNVDFIF